MLELIFKFIYQFSTFGSKVSEISFAYSFSHLKIFVTDLYNCKIIVNNQEK